MYRIVSAATIKSGPGLAFRAIGHAPVGVRFVAAERENGWIRIASLNPARQNLWVPASHARHYQEYVEPPDYERGYYGGYSPEVQETMERPEYVLGRQPPNYRPRQERGQDIPAHPTPAPSRFEGFPNLRVEPPPDFRPNGPLSFAANWYDSLKAHLEDHLHQLVHRHPSFITSYFATTQQVQLEVGGMFVDVLRIGVGVQRRSLWGTFEDGLRLLVILGPLARFGGWLAQEVRTLVMQNRLRLAMQVNGDIAGSVEYLPAYFTGPCGMQAIANAEMMATGRHAFINFRQILGGRRIPEVRTIGNIKTASGEMAAEIYDVAYSLDEVAAFFRSAGSEIRVHYRINSITDIARVAEETRAPVISAIKWLRLDPVTGEQELARHYILAFRTSSGRVMYADYNFAASGRYYTQGGIGTGLFHNSVDDLARRLSGGSVVPGSVTTIGDSGRNVSIAVDLANRGAISRGSRPFLSRISSAMMDGAAMSLGGLSLIQTTEGVEFAVPVSYTEYMADGELVTEWPAPEHCHTGHHRTRGRRRTVRTFQDTGDQHSLYQVSSTTRLFEFYDGPAPAHSRSPEPVGGSTDLRVLEDWIIYHRQQSEELRRTVPR